MVDVWTQHPAVRHLNHRMFDSIRRRMGVSREFEEEIPLEATVAAMDEAGVRIGLASAWYGPEGPLMGNDEVAGFVDRYPEGLRGVAGADLRDPMQSVRELRRRVEEGFVALLFGP